MNSRQQFEHRANTQIISLSDVTQDFFEPEHLRLKLSDRVIKKPIDIGCWAYFYRGKNESLNDDRGTPVVLDSFVESRRELIVKVLASFFGLRDASVRTQIRHMEYFINWLNLNNYREVFSGEADAQRAYRDYTANLNHQIAHRKLKPITAYAYQEVAAKVIELLYPESGHHILSSAVRITRERGSVAASSVHISLYRDVCLAVAQQCSDFVMNNKPYPWVVKIRDYEVVLFPSNSGAVGPFKNSPPPYNAAERRIATVEEYCASCDRLDRKWRYKSEVAHNIEGARASLKAANEDERHWHRFYMAGLAAKAFACLFLMITGATPTEFAQFSYEDALDVEKSPIKKELSAFKFRAGGKSTVYNIGRDTGWRPQGASATVS